MRRTLLTLLPASMILVGAAHASPDPNNLAIVAKIAKAQVVVPQDWDGIWTTVDTVYVCPTTFQSTSPGADTLCGGKDYSTAAPGSDIVFVCTGTADATTFDITCTGSGNVFPDCDADYNVVTHGTRTNDTFFTVSTINVTYTGTACVFGGSCIQINTHGTRTGSTTLADCAVTPTKRATWGQLKTIYR